MSTFDNNRLAPDRIGCGALATPPSPDQVYLTGAFVGLQRLTPFYARGRLSGLAPGVSLCSADALILMGPEPELSLRGIGLCRNPLQQLLPYAGDAFMV
jgi:hypothetical protein